MMQNITASLTDFHLQFLSLAEDKEAAEFVLQAEFLFILLSSKKYNSYFCTVK